MKHALLLLSLFFCMDMLHAQVIPQNRRVEWTLAGLRQPRPIYANSRDITLFGGVGNGILPNDLPLQLAILSLAGDSGVIEFPAGTYAFTQTINLRSGLVLRGRGADSTILQFDMGGDSSTNLITMFGGLTNTEALLTASALKNDTSIVVNNGSLFNAGDYVKLFQNDSALVFDVYRCVGQVLQVSTVSGNTVSFTSPLRRSYDLSTIPRLRLLNMITGNGIECLKIKRLDSTPDLTGNIVLDYAARCWIKGVESDSCNFAHVSLSTCTNIDISGCYFHGAFNYGGGGRGYGVAMNKTTGETLVENNIFRHLRHALLVQSGSNGNVFALNYAREAYRSESGPFDAAGDLVLHGNYPYANLFEGNSVNNIIVDFSHGKNGPLNTFFRNRADLYGIIFSNNSGDSTTLVGNEVTASNGFYLPKGIGNFEYGNNIAGAITPAGTDSLPDRSYYYSNEPYYWYFATPFPSIGPPNSLNTRTIPAKANYNAGIYTRCPTNDVLAAYAIVFSAEKKGGVNMLHWNIDNSNETAAFEVQHSLDGTRFTKLQTIDANEAVVSYAYTDELPTEGINYYRIVQVLKTRNTVYSKTIALNNTGRSGIRVYPNPAKQKLMVYADEATPHLQVRILNNVGRVVKDASLKTAGSNALSVDVSGLSGGVYFIEVLDTAKGSRRIEKFIKE